MRRTILYYLIAIIIHFYNDRLGVVVPTDITKHRKLLK